MRSAGLCGNFGISGLLQGLVARAPLHNKMMVNIMQGLQVNAT